MKREKEIDALIERAQKQLNEIRSEYHKSLHDQHITDLLKVDVKNYCENIRSVLDYLAHTIREEHCPNTNPKDRFYFPILPDVTSFSALMSKWYPGLQSIKPDLYQSLGSFQPFQAGFDWLGKLNRINSENKHGLLVEQTRQETVRITAKSHSGGQASWKPSGVNYGSGVFINGVPVDPKTQMPVPSATQTITKTIWVDFLFDDINTSALQLLERSMKGVKDIVSIVKKQI